MGDDLTVVNAARVSLDQQSESFQEKDSGLIRFLLANRHMTPFEHVTFQFRITAPYKVARQWMRHRAGSFNEVSSRYSILLPEFYTPSIEEVRQQTGKPGGYKYKEATETLASSYLEALRNKHQVDWDFYKEWNDSGIAKELISFELPMSTYTKFYWTVNLRSLLNFLSLRQDSQAMLEIKFLADKIPEKVSLYVPETLRIWNQLGRLGEDQ